VCPKDLELQHSLADTVTRIQALPLSFNQFRNTYFLRRARCFHNIFAIEYLVYPANAKTTNQVTKIILGALVPLKSERSDKVNIPKETLDLSFDL
jgi:hypothetical protein